MPCTHARFDHLQHYYPNNVALAKCKPRSRSISDCSACYIISHNRGKESGKKGRRKLRKTGKSTFVEQQESLARVYVCIHNELRLLPSKRDEPKRGPGQNASRTNTKNHPFTAERAFEIRHQITLLPVAAKRHRAALLSQQGNRQCDNVLFPPLPCARACRCCVCEPAV